jgi:hypothetical protein
MIIAGYRFDGEALLARLVYRWHWHCLALLLLAVFGIVLLRNPFWLGDAMIRLMAPPDAVVTVDGRAWSPVMRAGHHRFVATMPDGRRSWSDITLMAGITTTVRLSGGITVSVRPIPPAAPGMSITSVMPDASGWRVVSQPLANGVTALPPQTMHIGSRSSARMVTIDAYRGLADQVHVAGTLVEALARDEPDIGLALTMRGWPAQRRPIDIADDVFRVVLAPDGATVALIQPLEGGEQLTLLTAQEMLPVVAVAERSLASAGPLVPLAWSEDSLAWLGPDDSGASQVWRARLDTLVPQPLAPLDALAFTLAPDGTVRFVRRAAAGLEIGRMQAGVLEIEATVGAFAAESDLTALWHANELVIQAAGRAWLLTLGA